MSKSPRILFLIGILLITAALWPILATVNRIYPMILGLPLFAFYMLLLNFIVTAFLLIALRVLE